MRGGRRRILTDILQRHAPPRHALHQVCLKQRHSVCPHDFGNNRSTTVFVVFNETFQNLKLDDWGYIRALFGEEALKPSKPLK